MKKKILIITDAYNQINGVVRTLTSVAQVLSNEFVVSFLENSKFKTFPCPSYPEIKLALNPFKCAKFISKEKADYIHIATEGPIGLFSKIYLDYKKIPYTTSYHTMFPEYINERISIPLELTYEYFRWFHKKSKCILTTTESMKDILENHRFKNVKSWTRGVDRNIFHPYDEDIFKSIPKPIYSYIGRVSPEKNLDDFLSLELNGSKVVIGDGPYLNECKQKFKDVHYIGYLHKEDLGRAYSSSDVFVFPSKSDTFGLVMIEALACGTPVVGFNVQGPKDIVNNGINGFLCETKEQLKTCIENARFLKKNNCTSSSMRYTWEECARIFKETLQPVI
jgi:glycosyltransferase involved in cell wall biosynthesis